MYSFMRSCACLGRKPSHLVMMRTRQRSLLTSQLLRERNVARFIVAPDGFGKTSAALEYANVVFGYEHVFWVRCESPCFLRDLDRGTIAREIAEIDPQCSLIVFEDVPHFDEQRSQVFSKLIDTLLGAGREVIVTCSPSCDSFGELQQDRICLNSEMMLVSDDELTMEGIAVKPENDRTPSLRTPCMVWSDEGEKLLIQGLRHEELPADLVVGALTLLLLGQGSFEELESITGPRWAARIIEGFADAYPYVGINSDDGTFHSTPLSVDALAASMSRGLATLVRTCPVDDRDRLIERIVDTLLKRGQNDRACKILQCFGSVYGITRWLSQRGLELLGRGTIDAIIELNERLDRRRKGKLVNNDVITALAFGFVGDEGCCLELTQSILVSSAASESHRLVAEILRVIKARPDERTSVIQKAWDFLKRKTATDDSSSVAPEEEEIILFPVEESRAVLTTLCECGLEEDPARLLTQFWQRWSTTIYGTSLGAQLTCATALLRNLERLLRGEDSNAEEEMTCSVEGEALNALMTLVVRIEKSIEKRVSAKQFDCIDSAVLEGFVEALRVWPNSLGFALPEGCTDSVDRGLYKLMSERNVYAKRRRKALGSAPQASEGMLRDESGRAIARVIDNMPTMDVSLFGGFSIAIGGKRLNPRDLTRHKVRELLAVMILHHGREIPRERLVEMLWPDGDPVMSGKNLYGIWSRLKKTLTTDDACPYLIRSQSGFRLAHELVDSDVYRFEEFCRSLMFSQKMPMDWQEVFRKINEEFCEDLLPGDQGNATIENARIRYRAQLIDALVSVSHRLERTREAQGALWFARAAVERDNSREDAYIALMQAQISANQRSSALETYFECRRQLSLQLGIDPSPAIVALYRSIIEEEVEV